MSEARRPFRPKFSMMSGPTSPLGLSTYRNGECIAPHRPTTISTFIELVYERDRHHVEKGGRLVVSALTVFGPQDSVAKTGELNSMLSAVINDSSDGTLAPEAVAHFDHTGWVSVLNFFDAAAVSEISGWIDALLARPEVPGAHWVYHQPSLLDPSRQLVQRIENFCPHHVGFDALAHRSRLLPAVGRMLEGPVFLFKEKINFKESGGAGFELHQDQQAGWSRYAPLFVTVMVCIDAATIENGCLEMPSGLPRLDHLIADEWRPVNDGEATGLTVRPVPTRPGDVVFFDSYVPHASKANMSSGQRRVLFFTYNSQIHGDQRGAYHADKHASFPPDIERVPGAEYRFKV